MLATGTNSAVSAQEFAQARDSFEAVHADMKAKRARANVQMQLLARTKRWIEQLAPNTKLIIQHAPANGADLAQVRAELKELREELRKLQGNPPASSDIGKRVDDLVAGWGVRRGRR